MALLHLLLHLLLLSTTVTARNTTYCSEVERQALLAIKTGISGAATRLSSWKGFACCSWTGVGCTAGHVVKLDLHNSYDFPINFYAGLVSLLSPSLLHLTRLQYLDLSLNYFDSPIPTFIGSLAHLSYLNLSTAGFYGPIPHHFGNLTRLISLDLSSYRASYSANLIYSVLLHGGTRFFLTADSLIWLSTLKKLGYLDMGYNDLSNVTNCLDIIDTLPSLSVLYLSRSHLSGIPTTLSHFNQTSLIELDLSENDLGGTIPVIMGNLTKIQRLNLAFNSFTDIIQDTLQGLQSLIYLDLSYNHINSRIPDTLQSLRSLNYLDLSHNQISGRIPDTLQNLRSLSYLDISYNHISGKIPQTLGNLCNLTILQATSNNLAFGMSEFMEVLSQCNPARLQYLDMSYNMFTGYLTEYVGGIQSLQTLDLSNNMFNGSIPTSIG